MLLAAGVTSLILAQACLNFFAVMGLAPLTGVPMPFVSYGNSNLIVMLGGMGLLLNVAAHGGMAARKPLRSVEGSRADERRTSPDRDRGRRDSGARRAGAGNRRRAAG
jgi:cell division protein FtsW